MELTKNSTSMTGSLSDILKSGILLLGIIILVAMMALPLPVFLLDVFRFEHLNFFSDFNGSYAHFRPLDFSSFP